VKDTLFLFLMPNMQDEIKIQLKKRVLFDSEHPFLFH